MSTHSARTELKENRDGSVTVRYWSNLTDAEIYHFHRTSFADDTLVPVIENNSETELFESISYTTEFLEKYYDHEEFEGREFKGAVSSKDAKIPVDVKVKLESEGYELKENNLF